MQYSVRPNVDLRAQAAGDRPRYREVYHRFKDAILRGVYRHGARVPSIRTLAAELGLSRATIEKAYDLLIGEGLLMSNGQSGTTVCYVPPRKPMLHAVPLPDQSTANPARPRDIAGHGSDAPTAATSVAPFQVCVPALDAFPRAAWLKLSQRLLRDRREITELIDDIQGHRGLREAICGHLNVARGISCGPHQIIVTSGYRQSLCLLVNALIDREAAVWIEDPGYLPSYQILRQSGMRPVPVPVDSEGINVEAGRRHALFAAMAITTPTRQSPLGVAMSLRRRKALIDWAAQTGGWIVEDDYDNEFCFSAKHLPTIQHLDGGGRTCYLGSFSKTIHPNLRIGYIVAPDAALPRVAKAADIMLDGVSMLQQKVLAAFIAEGLFALHIKKSRGLYAARRKMLIDALSSRLGARLSVCPNSRGLQITALTAAAVSDVAICRAAARKGLNVASLSSRYISAAPRQGLLLGFANFADPRQLSCAIDLLEQCFDKQEHSEP